jgi:hypothetical protein
MLAVTPTASRLDGIHRGSHGSRSGSPSVVEQLVSAVHRGRLANQPVQRLQIGRPLNPPALLVTDRNPSGLQNRK